MDLTDTIAPNSDQLDAVDLLTGPRTFTIARVSKGDSEQPVNLHLAEFDRPWRPGKSMRRVLVACWGPDAAQYIGRRVTLWCDPSVRFGGAEVGGTRISHLSHLDKPRTIPLLVTRGKSAPYRVDVLPEAVPSAPEVSLALRVEQAVAAFGAGGIAVERLEAKIGSLSTEWSATDVAELQRLFDSLKRREITKEEAFPVDELTADDITAQAAPSKASAQRSEPPADTEPDPTLDPTWGSQTA